MVFILIKSSETFQGTWPFLPNFFDGNGFLMHYVDEGPRQANPIILLHGEPTWGYLYRKFIPELSKSYRVVVPDMMGFGKSETPQDKEYTLKTHVENLSRLIDYLKLTNITFVGQDWGGPITAAYSIRNPNKVKSFVLINTLFGYSKEERPKDLSPWFQWINKHYQDKTLEGIKQGDLKSLCSKPAILAYGMKDKAIEPDYAIRDFKALFPGSKVVEMPNAGHYSQEDEPELLINLIKEFMTENENKL